MEFTGNIFGYASSVVCLLDGLVLLPFTMGPAVDRLLLVLYRIGLVLENTPVDSMYHRGHPRCWIPYHARKPTVNPFV